MDLGKWTRSNEIPAKRDFASDHHSTPRQSAPNRPSNVHRRIRDRKRKETVPSRYARNISSVKAAFEARRCASKPRVENRAHRCGFSQRRGGLLGGVAVRRLRIASESVDVGSARNKVSSGTLARARHFSSKIKFASARGGRENTLPRLAVLA